MAWVVRGSAKIVSKLANDHVATLIRLLQNLDIDRATSPNSGSTIATSV